MECPIALIRVPLTASQTAQVLRGMDILTLQLANIKHSFGNLSLLYSFSPTFASLAKKPAAP